MILEIAVIIIPEGSNSEFEAKIKLGAAVLKRAQGYVSHNFYKGIENSHQYTLLIQWLSVEDHTIGFQQSDLFKEWRALIGEFITATPVVYHSTELNIS